MFLPLLLCKRNDRQNQSDIHSADGAAAAAAAVVLFSKSLYSAIALSRFLIANFHSS